MVHLSKKMIHTIGNEHVFGLQTNVIPRDLRKRFIGDRHGRRLAFYENEWLSGSVDEECVISAGALVVFDLYFSAEQARGESSVIHQKPYKVLTNPFFRGQNQILSSYGVKNLILAIIFDDFERPGG